MTPPFLFDESTTPRHQTNNSLIQTNTHIIAIVTRFVYGNQVVLAARRMFIAFTRIQIKSTKRASLKTLRISYNLSRRLCFHRILGHFNAAHVCAPYRRMCIYCVLRTKILIERKIHSYVCVCMSVSECFLCTKWCSLLFLCMFLYDSIISLYRCLIRSLFNAVYSMHNKLTPNSLTEYNTIFGKYDFCFHIFNKFNDCLYI